MDAVAIGKALAEARRRVGGVDIEQVAQTEGDRHRVEAGVGEGQVQRVRGHER